MGHPILLDLQQFLQARKGHVLVDGLHGQALGALAHAGEVVHGPKEADVAVGVAIGLHALEQGLAIVQRQVGGIQLQGRIGLDGGVVPALGAGIFHGEHMVRKGAAEDQLALVLGLGL